MEAKKKIVKTSKDLSPMNALNKIKAFVSPSSTAGILRDTNKRTEERLKKAGA
jgi:hypothetical protein